MPRGAALVQRRRKAVLFIIVQWWFLQNVCNEPREYVSGPVFSAVVLINPADGVGLLAGISYIFGQNGADDDYRVYCLVLGGGEAVSGPAFLLFFAPQTIICSDRLLALIDPISVKWLSAALDNNRDTALNELLAGVEANMPAFLLGRLMSCCHPETSN
jgi:hypothetical protein